MSRKRTVYAPKERFIRRVAGPFFCVLILFYLGFHMLSGERGVFALINSSRQLEELGQRLAEVKTERQMLENRVLLLSSGSLDLDMLDERARIVLGYTGKNERVIFLDN